MANQSPLSGEAVPASHCGLGCGGPREVRLHVSVGDGRSTTGERPTVFQHAFHEKKEGDGLKTRQTPCPTNIAEFLSLDLGSITALRFAVKLRRMPPEHGLIRRVT